MLSKCANPNCSARFRYLRGGQLFRFQTGDVRNTRTEFYWLCSQCSQRYKVIQKDCKAFVALRAGASGESEEDHPVEQERAEDPESGDTKPLLEALKYELYFLERGGYCFEQSVSPKSKLFFRDSVTCLNYGSLDTRESCSKCVLARFIPEPNKDSELACHCIPLNELGDTLASMPNKKDPKEIEELVRNWLRAKIRELENSTARARTRSRAAGVEK